jgi:RloB-like protein
MPKNNSRKSTFADFLEQLNTTRIDKPLIPNTKEEKKYFLIVCEGERTEPNYFNYFKTLLPKNTIEIDVEGQGDNTVNVVKKAIELRKIRNENTLLPNYDEVWAVFDKDDFPSKNFDNAVKLAESKGIESGHSNQSFELWYILHFQFLQSALHRDIYIEKLTRILKSKYKKNDLEVVKSIFEKGKVNLAIARAKKLESMHLGVTPAKATPYTRIYLLVERLLQFKNQ